MITGHLPILVILTFMFSALIMPIAGLISVRLPWMLAVGASLLSTILGGWTLWHVLENGPLHYAVGGWRPPIGIELVADPLSSFFVVVMGIISTVVLFHTRQMVVRMIHRGGMTYYSAAMLMLCGFAGMVGTGDLFNLYVFLEISSLASYALLGIGSGRAALSAFRYLILGTIGASFYLIGLGFLFIDTGSLNIQDLSLILQAGGLDRLSTTALIFMFVGIGIKMALLPLHQWLPDVYTDAPTVSTALVAPLGTKIAAYVLIRLAYDVFPLKLIEVDFHLLDVIAFLGAVGIVWGSVMAIPQQNMKRMLAYSSVAQIGYIALGIGLGTFYGYIGAVLHVVNHAFMKACLFLVAANMEEGGHGIMIDKLRSTLRKGMPITSASFVLAAISMIGLPPTAGFFSKWYLLLGSLQQDNWIFVAVIILSSLLNAVYFFRIIERMYLGGKEDPGPVQEKPIGAWLTAPVVFLAVSLLVLGFGNVMIVNYIITPMVPAF